MRSTKPASPTLLPLVGLFLVLGVLAVLQYRWTGELSKGERERMRHTVGDSARRLGHDFDNEISAIASRLRPDPGAREPLQYQTAEALYSLDSDRRHLVKAVWIVPLGPHTTEPLKLNVETAEWVASEAPSYIGRLQNSGAIGRGFRFQPLIPEVPAIILPSGQPRAPEPGGPPGLRGPGIGPSAFVIVELDRAAIANELLPQLVRRHFGDDDVREWTARVIDRSSGELIYASNDTADGKPDFTTDMLGLSSVDVRPGSEPAARGPRTPGGPGGGFRGGRPEPAPPPNAGFWTIELRHRDGTLEEAVARSRLRNLGLSGAVLVLLLAGGLITIANAHASRELARQQFEFVAAVTHELNTPIAAITSAGQNLADRVVTDESQIRRYGSMIAREGKRLGTMVDHVLQFAGMQGSSFTLSLAPTTVGEIIDHALASTAWMVEESGVVLEREVHDSHESIVCDRETLSRALENLVSNAVKYRGSSNRITVSARVNKQQRELEMAVTDEGLGMSQADRQRIFEPFVRGANVRDGAIRGSGLGLSIVRRIAEAHGGRVEVKSSPGRGSRFSILIPVKP